MRRKVKNIVWILVAAFLAYQSIYFRPLDEKLAEAEEVEFDVEGFASEMWTDKLHKAYDSATLITELLYQLEMSPEKTFEQKGFSLGIGNIGYFKVQGTGSVTSVNENNVMLMVNDRMVEIETEFIFGNAVRDASGLIRINEFDETATFNGISEAINQKIREEVIPDFRSKVAKGDSVSFKGAVELNKAHLRLDLVEIIPTTLEIMNKP